MKTQYDLLEHYWSVIVPMARKHGIKPWECVRICGTDRQNHPSFDFSTEDYTFALTILEGKPVFVGDKLWEKNIRKWLTVSEGFNASYYTASKVSWTPPTEKRTFMLGDKELPCPVKKGCGDYLTRVAGNDFYFTNCNDRNALDDLLYKLLTEARDKE